MDITSRPLVSNRLVCEQDGEYYCLIDPERPAWAVVNKIGAEIVKLCNGHNSTDDIITAIAKKYYKKHATIYSQIRYFLEHLSNAKIIYFAEKIPLSISESKPNLKEVYLEVTNKCNLRCIHCYNSSGQSLPNELNIHKIKNIVDTSYKLGAKSIILSGGDPLLRDECFEILKYAISQNLKVTLITNGTNINDNVAQSLSNLGVNVQISLDGASAKTHDKIRGKGAFEASMSGIKHLISYNMIDRLSISMVLMKQNIEDVPKMIQLCLDLEIPVVIFSPITKQGRAGLNWAEFKLSTEQKKQILDFLYLQSKILQEKIKIVGYIFDDIHLVLFKGGLQRNFGCSVGEKIRIAPNGNVYPCPFFDDLKHCIGNINKARLDEIIKGSENDKIHAAIYSRANTIEKCKNCCWKYYCGGGCMADSYQHYGTIWREDSFCEARQFLYKRFIFRKVREGVNHND